MFKNYKNNECYVIAEIGGNFINFDQAKLLIDEAQYCGVDAVKLQSYRAETVASKNAFFQMENTGNISQFDYFKQYEVDENLHRQVFEYAKSRGLDWFSTPSHESDVDMLEECGVGAYKVGSDDAVNLPFLRYIARLGKPIFLSTGMCTLDEVRNSVDAILGEGNTSLILLHAITSYPTHPKSVNLKAIQTLIQEFPTLDVGYSDHTLSPVACLCAVAMGARVIERHFTYDKNAEGPDHMLSADPTEMKWLVDAVRNFEIMKGNGVKEPADSEKITRINNRKSIVLNCSMNAGQKITLSNLSIKRPGFGIEPKYLEEIIGRSINRDLLEDTVLSWEYIT